MNTKLASAFAWLINGTFAVLCLVALLWPPTIEIPAPPENATPACADRVAEFRQLQSVYAEQLPAYAAVIYAAKSPAELKKKIGDHISHDAYTTPYGRLNYLVAQDEVYLDPLCNYRH